MICISVTITTTVIIVITTYYYYYYSNAAEVRESEGFAQGGGSIELLEDELYNQLHLTHIKL